MSKLYKASRKAKPSVPEGFIPISQLPNRKVKGTGQLPNELPGVRVVSQDGVFSHVINPNVQEGSTSNYSLEELEEDEEFEIEATISDTGDNVKMIEAEKRANKKKNQWRKWSEEVIPAMLSPYLDLLQETESLRNIGSEIRARGCSGCSKGSTKDISCIYFERKCLSAFLFYCCL